MVDTLWPNEMQRVLIQDNQCGKPNQKQRCILNARAQLFGQQGAASLDEIPPLAVKMNDLTLYTYRLTYQLTIGLYDQQILPFG